MSTKLTPYILMVSIICLQTQELLQKIPGLEVVKRD